MFERYTEKARRVVFYARYEASRYGSLRIETEHMLLGLLREDHTNINSLLPAPLSVEEVRIRVENEITIREPVSTSAEIPFTPLGKRVLNLAAREADNCGDHHIGTEHILLSLLRVEEGLAYQILRERELDLGKLEARVRQMSPQVSSAPRTAGFDLKTLLERLEPFDGPEPFLMHLRASQWEALRELIHENAVLVDADGKRWSGHAEIFPRLQQLLAAFITKNAKYQIEAANIGSTMFWVGTVLWDHIHLKPNTDPGRARMTLGFTRDSIRWTLSLLQITAVADPAATAKTTAG
jgi:ketosteroid isomerase-like protein